MVVAEGADAADAPGLLTLVSGPASSGKSRWAEHLAQVSGRPVVYIATGPSLPNDRDWQERLRRHRRRRPDDWCLVESEGALAEALDGVAAGHLALVESLGTWVAAHLDCGEPAWQELQARLQASLRRGPEVVLVIEECGWGVVPATAAGGRFRQRLGEMQQRLAAEAQASWLVVQGRALDLHALGCPVPQPTDHP
jgi:adenosylcobinamide kinase/adenosylcobinamide-phosphate guanylyltransferase